FQGAFVQGPSTNHNLSLNPAAISAIPCPVWADFNGDGMMDVLDVTSGVLWAFDGVQFKSTQWWTVDSLPAPFPSCNDLGIDPGYRLADFNGDGLIDLLVVGPPELPTSNGNRIQAMITKPDASGATLLTLGIDILTPPAELGPLGLPLASVGPVNS